MSFSRSLQEFKTWRKEEKATAGIKYRRKIKGHISLTAHVPSQTLDIIEFYKRAGLLLIDLYARTIQLLTVGIKNETLEISHAEFFP